MKHINFALKGLALMLLPVTAVYSQSLPNNAEEEIRKLEEKQVEYLMNGKVAERKKNWASDFTVNNPFNLVQDAATGPIQSGVLTYSKFERNIEKVLLHDSVIVVMGNEQLQKAVHMTPINQFRDVSPTYGCERMANG